MVPKTMPTAETVTSTFVARPRDLARSASGRRELSQVILVHCSSISRVSESCLEPVTIAAIPEAPPIPKETQVQIRFLPDSRLPLSASSSSSSFFSEVEVAVRDRVSRTIRSGVSVRSTSTVAISYPSFDALNS